MEYLELFSRGLKRGVFAIGRFTLSIAAVMGTVAVIFLIIAGLALGAVLLFIWGGTQVLAYAASIDLSDPDDYPTYVTMPQREPQYLTPNSRAPTGPAPWDERRGRTGQPAACSMEAVLEGTEWYEGKYDPGSHNLRPGSPGNIQIEIPGQGWYEVRLWGLHSPTGTPEYEEKAAEALQKLIGRNDYFEYRVANHGGYISLILSKKSEEYTTLNARMLEGGWAEIHPWLNNTNPPRCFWDMARLAEKTGRGMHGSWGSGPITG